MVTIDRKIDAELAVDDLLAVVDDETAGICVLLMHGLTRGEVAQHFEISEDALNGKLRQARRKAKDLR